MAEEEGRKKKKVMVAIDESECSRYALTWAIENLADTISKSHLILFTAQSLVFSYTYASAFADAPPELVTSMQENQRKNAIALLERAKEMCSKHGIDAETITEVGDPKDAICEAVEKHNVELLVLGSHSRGPIQSLFAGQSSSVPSSIVEAVLPWETCAVQPLSTGGKGRFRLKGTV